MIESLHHPEVLMPNQFDGDVFLDENARLLVRNTIGTVLLEVLYTSVDPNGILSAPKGSIASGPAGTWIGAGGAVWGSIAPGGTNGATLVWGPGVPWSTVEAALNSVGGRAIVLVVGEDSSDPTIPKLMTREPVTGYTDLSGVLFQGIWANADVSVQGPVLVDFDASPGLEFQIGSGGILQSQDILWRYGTRIGTGAGVMGRLDWTFSGGGVAPQPGYTSDIVRIGKGAGSRIRLRNGARIGDAALVDPMIAVTPFDPPPPYVLLIEASTGSVIGPNTVTTPVPNPFAPYGVPLTYDASVTIDPGAFTAGSYPILSPLDMAVRTSFDPSLTNLLTSTDVQSAIDEMASVVMPTWADTIPSWSTPLDGTVEAPTLFDRTVTVPADVLEAGDVLEILAAGEYTVVTNPGFDMAGISLLLGSFGPMNGNFGPIPQSGSQFVMKAKITIGAPGAPGTMFIYQENDFATQLSSVLQLVPQQTGPHVLDTTVDNTIEVRASWGLGTPDANAMVLKTLTANVIKKA